LQSLIPGRKNVVRPALINPEKGFFTSAAHQIWTHKKFSSRQRLKIAVGQVFCFFVVFFFFFFFFWKNDFPRIGDAKFKEGVFVGNQIR